MTIQCACGCGTEISSPRVYFRNGEKRVQKFVSGHNHSEVGKLCSQITKEELESLYINEHKSATDIGKIFNVNSPTVVLLLKKKGIKTRDMKNAQRNYLKHNNNRSLKQSKFMKSNNPMNNQDSRKKCSQPGKLNAMWKGGKKEVICKKCGKSRLLKPSRYKALVLKGMCWNCYKHSMPNSSLEIKMREELIKRGIEFKEQFPFRNMFLDFLLPNKVVIECDGTYWHNLPENKKRDIRKNKYLKDNGYKLFRFTDKEINNNVGLCIDKVIK